MKKSTSVVMSAAGGVGLAAMVAAVTDVRPSHKVAADLVKSFASGVILGSNVWPYGLGPIPPELQSKQSVSVGFPDCGWRARCSIYGLASAGFFDGQRNSAEE
jgi:hypothetical protein